MDRQLSEFREQLAEVDRKLVALVARRQELASRIGSIKRHSGVPTRDYAREKDVLELAEAAARDEGVPADVVRSVMQMLIRASLTTQERARVSAEGRGAGRQALVIGGAGKMGSWFREFLASQGYAVTVSDPAGPVDGYAYATDWRAPAKAADVVVVATSIGVTARLLRELAEVEPRGLVFDIGSLKTPLKDGLHALGAAGCRVASVHPMFGPDTRLLSGRHVIFVDAGSAEASAEARELFASTMAEQVEMELEEHDRLIAFVLGLSHALNLAFFSALAESGEGADRLARLSSTTFDAQLAVASTVARESPALYFEIQALNEYGDRSLEVLGEAVRRIRDIVREGDERAFAALMESGRRYLESRP